MGTEINAATALIGMARIYQEKVGFQNAPFNTTNIKLNAARGEKSLTTGKEVGKAFFYSGEDIAVNKTNTNSGKYRNEPAIEIFEMAEKTRSKKNTGKSELEEELETSVIFPSYFNPRLKNKLVKAWKNIVSGQAFTGSWLELRALRWSTRNGPISELRDCNRRTVQNTGSSVFKGLCTPNQILDGTFNKKPVSYLYLKSRFTLSLVNEDNTVITGGAKRWAGLKDIAKGATWGEPDVILREIKADGSIVLSIFEFKIGFGKPSDSGAKATEWNQLSRVKRNLELLIDLWIIEKGGAAEVKKKYPLWKRPTIKLYFVGWSAPSAATVQLIAPTNYAPPTGYNVEPLNSTGFGTLTGLNASFITHIIEELQYARAMALVQAIEEIRKDPEYQTVRNAHMQNMMRQMAQARQLPMKPISEVSSVRQGNKPKPKTKANASGMGQVAAQEQALVNILRQRGKNNANFIVQSAITDPEKFTSMYATFLKHFIEPGGAPTNTGQGRMRNAIRRAREGKEPGNTNLEKLNIFNTIVSSRGAAGGLKKTPGAKKK
jgi:hypothetical protein